MHSALHRLARKIAPTNTVLPQVKTGPAPLRWTRGVVQSVNADGSVVVQIDGKAVNCTADSLGGSAPALGSVVEVTAVGKRLVVLGGSNDQGLSGWVVGEIKIWPFTALPAAQGLSFGWVNGQTLLRANYPVLWAMAAGSPLFGPGNGSTTFTLPSVVDRFLVGSGDLYAAGAEGGAASTTLGVLQIPLLDATVSDPGHSHVATPGYNTPIEATSTLGTATPGDGNITFDEISTSSNTTGITATVGTKTPSAVPTLPPYLAIPFAIRLA